MPWVKLDDQFFSHPKVAGLSTDAKLLFLAALGYSAGQLTDGRLAPAAVRIAAALAGIDTRDSAVGELLGARLWEADGEHYRIHDYFDYQPSAAEVRLARAKNARRQALFNDPGLTRAVRARDGDRCRYCGETVIWRDRRSPRGGTYDHVDPNGPNTLDNLVVACRACNAAKGDRTPEEAGMPLLPPPSAGDLPETGRFSANPVPAGSRPPPGPSPAVLEEDVPLSAESGGAAAALGAPRAPNGSARHEHLGRRGAAPGPTTTAQLTDLRAAFAAARNNGARVGLLVEWYRTQLGPGPPQLGDRLAATVRAAHGDYALVASRIVEVAARPLQGDPLNYLQATFTREDRDHGTSRPGARAARRDAGSARTVSAQRESVDELVASAKRVFPNAIIGDE